MHQDILFGPGRFSEYVVVQGFPPETLRAVPSYEWGYKTAGDAVFPFFTPPVVGVLPAVVGEAFFFILRSAATRESVTLLPPHPHTSKAFL